MKRVLLAVALCAASPAAYAQSAQEWAVQGMGESVSYRQIDGKKLNNRHVRFAHRVMRAESRLAGVYAPLAAKAREIESACGSRVISGLRHTRVSTITIVGGMRRDGERALVGTLIRSAGVVGIQGLQPTRSPTNTATDERPSPRSALTPPLTFQSYHTPTPHQRKSA